MKFLLIILMCLPLDAISLTQTRGVRNNNPGNLRPKSWNWKAWPGAIGTDEQGHLIFSNHTDGIRAIVINLKLYKKKHDIQTIDGIINRWVDELPLKDRQQYVNFVSQQLKVSRHAILNLNDAMTLKLLTKAIVTYENGFNPYTERVYKSIFPYI